MPPIAGPSKDRDTAILTPHSDSKRQESGQAVPFEYFSELLQDIAVINQAQWPFHDSTSKRDVKYRRALRLQGNQGHSGSKERQGFRKKAVLETCAQWIKRLPAGAGPGPQACAPGTTEIFFRLLFPEEDARRKYGVKETTMIHHLTRLLGVHRDDPAAHTLSAWASPPSSQKTTSGSGCLAIEFARQLRNLGEQDHKQPTALPKNALSPADQARRIWGPLTLQHVDILLDELASSCSFTDDSIRSCWTHPSERQPNSDGKRKAQDEGPTAGPPRRKQRIALIQTERTLNPKYMRTISDTTGSSPMREGSVSCAAMTNFCLIEQRPDPNSKGLARTPSEIIDFLCGPAIWLQSRAFMVQIILKDLSPVLYPLPLKQTGIEQVEAAATLLSDHNTNSIAKVDLGVVMALWHPAMPALWKVRCGDSFASVGAEIERLGWPSAAVRHPLLADSGTIEAIALAKPRPFQFVQLPKSLKATSCVLAAHTFGHAGRLWAERKYDGERYQVHVSFDNHVPDIKIFSTSKRDSSHDRRDTHAIVLAALGHDPSLSKYLYHTQLDSQTRNSPASPVKHNVILDAEMVAFDEHGECAEFHKIAKVKDRPAPTYPGILSERRDAKVEVVDKPTSMEDRFQWKRQTDMLKMKRKEENHRLARLKAGELISSSSDSENEITHWYERSSLPTVSQASNLTETGTYHLGLVFFDVLHLDNESLLHKSYEQRRSILESIITPIPSFALLAERTLVDFGPHEFAMRRNEEMLRQFDKSPKLSQVQAFLEKDPYWKQGMASLITAFARSHARREEGLMLKAADGPYVGGIARPDLSTLVTHFRDSTEDQIPTCVRLDDEGSIMRGSWVKMKADYIPGLGDSLDLAIIGASWEAGRGRELRVGTDGYTTFYLAAVLPGYGGKRRLRCWSTASYGLTRQDLASITERIESGELGNIPFCYKQMKELPYILELAAGFQPTILFKEPLIAEVVGGGFSKPAGDEFYMLRWPRINKIYRHTDRTWKDAVDFNAMQDMAIQAVRKLENEGQIEEAFEARARRIVECQKLSGLDLRPTSVPPSGQGKRKASTAESANVAVPPSKRRRGRDPQPSAQDADSPTRQILEGRPLRTISTNAVSHATVSNGHLPPSSCATLKDALKQEEERSRSHAASSGTKKVEALSRRILRSPDMAPQTHLPSAPVLSASWPWTFPTLVQQMTTSATMPCLPLITPPSSSPEPRCPSGSSSPALANGLQLPGSEFEHAGPVQMSATTAAQNGSAQSPCRPRDRLLTPEDAAPTKHAQNGETTVGTVPSPRSRPPRSCRTSPRLMDFAYSFFRNVPDDIIEGRSVMLNAKMRLYSLEALVASTVPVQTTPLQESRRPGPSRILSRSRSFERLRNATIDPRRSGGILFMDTSNQEDLALVHKEIRRLVTSQRRRMDPSVSAPSVVEHTEGEGKRRQCSSNADAYLARSPIIVVDITDSDKLGFEQWDCADSCAQQGADADAGICECCPHVDSLLWSLAKPDPAANPHHVAAKINAT
ncbi:hypothetical protein OC861_000365 [Tilletia horrida]|nr:hypothetical protein OC861_000365 [Tilletia horrida]